jgi:hypothetical protein
VRFVALYFRFAGNNNESLFMPVHKLDRSAKREIVEQVRDNVDTFVIAARFRISVQYVRRLARQWKENPLLFSLCLNCDKDTGSDTNPFCCDQCIVLWMDKKSREYDINLSKSASRFYDWVQAIAAIERLLKRGVLKVKDGMISKPVTDNSDLIDE